MTAAPPRLRTRFPSLAAPAMAVLFLALSAGSVLAQARFPKPDFTSGYALPQEQQPAVEALWQTWADVGILFVALCVSAWLALVRRSRRGLFALAVFGAAYFGFVREGCICPVGSLQNVALALADPDYAAPIPVVLFFALPLLFALLFGRSFCAGVCPLGAVQEAVVLRPVRLPGWLERALGLLPHLYLALSLVFVVTGAGFLVCRYDPFVHLFRLGGPAHMVVFAFVLLAVGMFVARPYCRFLCPYGVLLGWLSRLSWRHLSITPDKCIQCRWCANACPYGALREAVPEPEPAAAEAARRKARRTWLALPLWIAIGAAAGAAAGPALSKAHTDVSLLAELRAEDAAGKTDTSWPTRAFRSGARTRAQLEQDVAGIRHRFVVGTALAGAFLGCVFGMRLASSFPRRRRDYEPDHAECVSCGRCFASCPREQLRLRRRDAPPAPAPSNGDRHA